MPVEDVYAQSADKTTKKELKEYMKNPNSYRKMIRGYKDQIDAYEVDLNEVTEDYHKVDYLRTVYYDSIQELNAMIADLKETTPSGMASTPANNTAANNTGTDYRVQIGAYQYFDFTDLIQFNEPIGFERVSGVIHYHIGSWASPYDAFDFAQAMRKLNIKGAFVTMYQDGNRMPYDHVMESGGTVFNE